jgi:hypothetical protein
MGESYNFLTYELPTRGAESPVPCVAVSILEPKCAKLSLEG